MATGTLLDGTCMKRDESLRSVPRREAPSHEPEPPLHERTVQQGAEPAEPGTTGPAAAARGGARRFGCSARPKHDGLLSAAELRRCADQDHKAGGLKLRALSLLPGKRSDTG